MQKVIVKDVFLVYNSNIIQKGAKNMEVMNYTLRINKTDKQKAEEVFKTLGMTFSTGINVYLKTVGREKKNPKALDTNQNITKTEALKKFRENLKVMQEEAKTNGTDNMTMDEIDDIIAEVRREKNK
jgi:addiction module RelB/DinJ family antitoxin